MVEETSLFNVKRSLDYTVTQEFLVRASDPDEAIETVAEFCDNSGWGHDESIDYGVAQTSDSMEQIENSQTIVCDEQPTQVIAIEQDFHMNSLNKLMLQEQSAEMFALLKTVAQTPAMFHANVSALGMQIKAYVDSLEAKLGEPLRTLQAVVGAPDSTLATPPIPRP